MTLADLCTALLERESVIYTFTETGTGISRKGARVVSMVKLTWAAKRLGTFIRSDLQRETGCSYEQARKWCDVNDGTRIARLGNRVTHGGVAIVWRWL